MSMFVLNIWHNGKFETVQHLKSKCLNWFSLHFAIGLFFPVSKVCNNTAISANVKGYNNIQSDGFQLLERISLKPDQVPRQKR